MSDVLDMKAEVERAIQFGMNAVSHDMPLPVTFACFKDSAPSDRLLIGCRPYDDDEDVDAAKERTFMLMGFGARYWGATDVLFIADTYLAMGDAEHPVDTSVRPSDQPDRKEAIVVYRFNRSGPIGMTTQMYGRDDDGDIYPQDRMEDDALGRGRVTDVMRILEIPDSEFETNPVPMDAEQYLYMLAVSGFAVMETTNNESRAYIVVRDEDEHAEITKLIEELGHRWEDKEFPQ